MGFVKNIIFRLLIYLKLYPHIFFIRNCFKIYEFEELQKGLKFSSDEKVLDLGCGNGLQTLIIGKRYKKVIGIDISKNSIANAQRKSLYLKKTINSVFQCVKIENAQFENEYFDKIFSFCVIEHIPNYEGVLREAYRILKKNGQMIFSVDTLENIEDNTLREKHRNRHNVEKYFQKLELKNILEEIGFKRIDMYPICKSNFAKQIFIRRNKKVTNKFKYGFLLSILSYMILRYKERRCAYTERGLFLVIKCVK